MPYQVEVKYAPPQTIAVLRRLAKQSELSRVAPDGCGKVWNFLRAAGFAGGRHVAVYLDCAINLEVGAEVMAPFVGDGDVFCSATPVGIVATTSHIGPYHRLNEAHQAIRDWSVGSGRQFAGTSWEIYGHWTDDPTQLRTDVIYLLTA
ncbi:MAG TPA: GyrI-like domain-containing protein [Pirellulales bacterium]|jgi:effector-binding domain-containing protein